MHRFQEECLKDGLQIDLGKTKEMRYSGKTDPLSTLGDKTVEQISKLCKHRQPHSKWWKCTRRCRKKNTEGRRGVLQTEK